MSEIFEKLLVDTIIGKIVTNILLPLLPVLVALDWLRFTSYYWWDLVIAIVAASVVRIGLWYRFYI